MSGLVMQSFIQNERLQKPHDALIVILPLRELHCPSPESPPMAAGLSHPCVHRFLHAGQNEFLMFSIAKTQMAVAHAA